MKKIHTRTKRKLGISSGHSGKILSKKKRKRPTTFKTEKAAKEWAEKHNIKNYTLVRAKKNKRFVLQKI